MNIELKGKVLFISNLDKINDKLLKKSIVVTIEEETQYPQDISVEVLNKSIEQLESVNVGDYVTITANLRGRENKGKYYNSLIMYNIKK